MAFPGGENRTSMGEEDLLRSRGVEVVADMEACYELMQKFIRAKPDL